jgi:1,4-alpha-glucan branching enzyme
LEDKPWSDNVDAHPQLRLHWAGLEGGDRHMADFHRCVRELIGLRHRFPALRAEGFRVSHVHDHNRVLVFHRWIPGVGVDVIVALNLAESTHVGYRLGLPRPGWWAEVFNTDVYDHWVNPWRQGNGGGVVADGDGLHDFAQSAAVTLPANAVVVLA